MSAAPSLNVPPHAALRWLIRWTGALLAVASTGMAIFLLCAIVIRQVSEGLFRWEILLAILMAVLFCGFFAFAAKRGYDMFRKLNTVIVADFSFVFALVVAVGWSNSLPLLLPKAIAEYCAGNAFFYPFLKQGPGPTYRYYLGLVAFIVFYKLIKAWVLQTLELNASTPSKGRPQLPNDPSSPEFPQKSPLVQL